MKKILLFLISMLAITGSQAYTDNAPLKEYSGNESNAAGSGTGTCFDDKKVLIAYFSWGGTTQRMAQQIQEITGADMFRIEPVTPYPTSYTPCTEVALNKKTARRVRPSRVLWRIGRTTTWYSSAVPCGGGPHP